MLSIVLLTFNLCAKEFFDYGQSIRAYGMGGAYSAIVDDEEALFFNPAALSRVKGFNWRVLDLGLGVPGLKLYQDIQSGGSSLSGLSSLAPYYGKNIWLGFGGKSSLALPYFGASGFSQGYANLALHRPPYPSLDLTIINDVGFAVGGAFSVGSIFSAGAAFKRITRSGGSDSLGVDRLMNISSDTLNTALENKGIGYGIDVGVLLVAPVPMSPALSIAWQDIGSTAYQPVGGTVSPDRTKDNLTMGLGVKGDVPLLSFAAALDYKHITDNEEQIGKKIHMGTEIGIGPIDLRAGFHQGYTTYGVGLDIFIMQFEAAMYTVETGVYPGQTPADRLALSLHLDLGFDPDFNLTGFGGKRRKLKQRR